MYAFLWQLILHIFNYTIITYGYFNIQSWDKNHATQYEMVVPLKTYKLTTEKELFSSLKCSIIAVFDHS